VILLASRGITRYRGITVFAKVITSKIFFFLSILMVLQPRQSQDVEVHHAPLGSEVLQQFVWINDFQGNYFSGRVLP